jgi:hypothetical protein
MKGSKTVLHIASIKLSTNDIKAGAEIGIDWFICVHTTGRYSKFKSDGAEYIEIEDRGCKKICVNGHLAGDCRLLRNDDDRFESITCWTDRQPAG